MSSPNPPKAILFDIGGVVVVSPMQAIHDYEAAHGIPHNWVNFAIARSSERVDGAWQRLERGAIELDAAFFRAFHADLHDYTVWRSFCSRTDTSSTPNTTTTPTKNDSTSSLPPLPQMDVTTLFWAMMIISRDADAAMTTAMKALRASDKFVLGALSNTVAFPNWHPFGAETAGARGYMRDRFDVFVSSAHVGVRKPHRDAYEYAIRELDRCSQEKGKGRITAQDVIFLDDIGQNLRAAKQLGMRTIKVPLGNTRQAVGELEKITGLKLSEEENKTKARL